VTAFTDGIARVLAAPIILAATIALVVAWGPPHDVRHTAGAVLLWAFLSGGTLDRYARRRPTRADGFFAACGRHLGTMLRLALAMALAVAAVHLVIGRGFPNDYVHGAAFVLALAMALLLTVAQVRVAVEDRRSALGALLAAARFLVRHPSAFALFALFTLAFLGVMLAGERTLPGGAPGLPAWSAATAFTAVECLLLLAWYATATSFFQARLAHAAYTAAPPLEWPESPAAEAIANRR
jgi:hypothetical protein